MLTAKSMYHGGELVSAIDVNVDFDSYKTLGLLCPFCNEPVFLCGETVRQSSSTKKLSYIQPHFKHFPGGDPMDFDCEKRSISPEGKRYLDAIRAERRGQRLELFNRYFVKMLVDGITNTQVGIMTLGEIRNNTNVNSSDIWSYRKIWKDQIETLKRSAADWSEHYKGSCPHVGRKIHLAIVCEVFDWLATKSSGYAWKTVGKVFYMPGERKKDWGSRRIEKLGLQYLYNRSIADLEKSEVFFGAQMLSLVDWQQQIEEKSRLTRAKDFAKAL